MHLPFSPDGGLTAIVDAYQTGARRHRHFLRAKAIADAPVYTCTGIHRVKQMLSFRRSVGGAGNSWLAREEEYQLLAIVHAVEIPLFARNDSLGLCCETLSSSSSRYTNRVAQLLLKT